MVQRVSRMAWWASVQKVLMFECFPRARFTRRWAYERRLTPFKRPTDGLVLTRPVTASFVTVVSCFRLYFTFLLFLKHTAVSFCFTCQNDDKLIRFKVKKVIMIYLSFRLTTSLPWLPVSLIRHYQSNFALIESTNRQKLKLFSPFYRQLILLKCNFEKKKQIWIYNEEG